jgi:hypothetical protein
LNYFNKLFMLLYTIQRCQHNISNLGYVGVL